MKKIRTSTINIVFSKKKTLYKKKYESIKNENGFITFAVFPPKYPFD